MQDRTIWPQLLKELKSDQVLVLTGPRQVGKTTTVQWLLSQLKSKNSYYFDLENIRNRDLFSLEDYDALIPEFQNVGLDTSKKMYIALDEIQLLPNLPSVIKYLHDHYQIKFIITGSSSYYLKNLFSESMAGRKVIYELFPLSFSEFLRFKGEEYSLPEFSYDLKFSDFAYAKLQTYYDEYVTFGGLPKVVLTQSQDQKRQLLESIFSSYLNLDVQSLADFKSLNDFRRLVRLLASRIGNKINVTHFSEVIGVSRQTITSYLEFMEQTYLIRLIKPLTKSSDVQVRIAPKLYFVDTGIANINYDLSAGARYENTVCHQLSLHAETTAFGLDLTYSDQNNAEIDFVLNKSQAFEVKETPVASYLPKLRRTAKKVGIDRFRLVGRKKPANYTDFLWGGMIR